MAPKYKLGQLVKIVDVRDEKGLPKYPELQKWIGKVGKVVTIYSLIRSKNRYIYNIRVLEIENVVEIFDDDAITEEE